MEKEYLIIKKDVLPDYFGKVLEVKKMLATGKSKDISEAVKLVGISRSTYYKYKELVFSATENESERKAILSLTLKHQPGVLGKVLSTLSGRGSSIYTISQNPPIGDTALVVISIIIEDLNCEVPVLVRELSSLGGVLNCHLIGMD